MAKKSPWAGKLPKRVAGVKVPKSLRRGPLSDFVMSPFGQNLLAEVIYHAGAAFADRTTDAAGDVPVVKRGARQVRNVASEATELAANSTTAVSRAVRAGVQAFVTTLRQHNENDMTIPPAAETKLAEELRDAERWAQRH